MSGIHPPQFPQMSSGHLTTSAYFTSCFAPNLSGFLSAGQNVGSAPHPQDRGWQQLWSVNPGGDGS